MHPAKHFDISWYRLNKMPKFSRVDQFVQEVDEFAILSG